MIIRLRANRHCSTVNNHCSSDLKGSLIYDKIRTLKLERCTMALGLPKLGANMVLPLLMRLNSRFLNGWAGAQSRQKPAGIFPFQVLYSPTPPRRSKPDRQNKSAKLTTLHLRQQSTYALRLNPICGC